MTKLSVTGMSCGGCVKSVAKIIARTTDSEADKVDVDLQSNTAEFPDVPSDTLDTILAKLDAAGFTSTVAPS